jgi:hypothetical protein
VTTVQLTVTVALSVGTALCAVLVTVFRGALNTQFERLVARRRGRPAPNRRHITVTLDDGTVWQAEGDTLPEAIAALEFGLQQTLAPSAPMSKSELQKVGF